MKHSEMGAVARALAASAVPSSSSALNPPLSSSPTKLKSAKQSQTAATSSSAQQNAGVDAATPAQIAQVLRQVPRMATDELSARIAEFLRLYREELPSYLIPDPSNYPHLQKKSPAQGVRK